MSYTSYLGTSDSYLANIQLAVLPTDHLAADTISFSQTATNIKQKAYSSELGVYYAQLGLSSILAYSINQAIILQTVTQTITFSQTASYLKQHPASATNTLTFTGTASKLHSNYVICTDSITFTQSGFIPKPYTSQPGNSIAIPAKSLILGYQSGFISPQLTQSQTQALILNQTVICGLILKRTSAQNLIFNQSIPTNAFHSITTAHVIPFTQTAYGSRIWDVTTTQTLIFTDLAYHPAVYTETNTSTLTFTHLALHIIIRNVSNVLTFSQIASVLRVANLVNDELIFFEHGPGVGVNYVRSVSDVLTFNTQYERILPIAGFPSIFIPQADYIIVQAKQPCTVILQTNDSVIILPCPELGDKISNSHSLVIRKSMFNDTYSYIKRSELQKLEYTFYLGRMKSLELREFLLNNFAKVITMTNWKGEKWLVHIMTSPPKLDPKVRWENEKERVDTTLEFEGTRLI